MDPAEQAVYLALSVVWQAAYNPLRLQGLLQNHALEPCATPQSNKGQCSTAPAIHQLHDAAPEPAQRQNIVSMGPFRGSQGPTCGEALQRSRR